MNCFKNKSLQERTQVNPTSVSLETLKGFLERGKMELSPKRQRGYVWSTSQQKSFLKDFLFNDDLPLFFSSSIILTKNGNNGWDVADGKQRLTTLLYNMGVSPKLLNISEKKLKRMYDANKDIGQHVKEELENICLPVIKLPNVSINEVFAKINSQKQLQDWDRDKGFMSNIAAFVEDNSNLFSKFFPEARLAKGAASVITMALKGFLPESTSYGFSALWKYAIEEDDLDEKFTEYEASRMRLRMEQINSKCRELGIKKRATCGDGYVICFLSQILSPSQEDVSDTLIEKFASMLGCSRQEMRDLSSPNRTKEYKAVCNHIYSELGRGLHNDYGVVMKLPK